MSNYITDDLKQQVKSIIKGLPKQKSWDDDEDPQGSVSCALFVRQR